MIITLLLHSLKLSYKCETIKPYSRKREEKIKKNKRKVLNKAARQVLRAVNQMGSLTPQSEPAFDRAAFKA